MNTQSPPRGDRLTKRLLWTVGLLSVLLFAVIANAVLHGGAGPDPMAAAGERTAAMPGAQIAIDVSYRIEGSSDSYDGHGGGVYNARTGRSRVQLALPISAKTSIVRAVGDETNVYLRAWNLNATLPPGKEWTRIETMLGHFTETAFATNGGAETTIAAVAAVDGGDRLGRETIRGEPTTRYRGTAGFAREAEVLREAGEDSLATKFELLAERYPAAIPVEAWIDKRGLARKIRIVEPLPEPPGERPLMMDLTMELFDLGAEPRVDLPAPNVALDYSPVARAELQMLNGAANADLIAATPPELPEAEFRRRGLAICGGIRSELESISVAAAKAFERRGAGSLSSHLSPLESLATARLWAANLTGPIAHLERAILKPLAALGPPSDVAAPYRRLLERFATDAEARAAQAAALESGAFKIYKQVENEFFTGDIPEQEALLQEVGLGGCLKSQPGAETSRPGEAA